MNQPQIPSAAIVICNHNYGQYVCDAIASASNQDYPAKCIFVVDDASTDDSVKRIEEFVLGPGLVSPVVQENEEYILLHMQGNLSCPLYLFRLKRNGGPSRARNFAIKLAIENKFHIIAILDADDIWQQGKLSKSVAKILENPERIGGVYTDYYIQNVVTGVTRYESKAVYDFSHLQRDCIIHSGCVINSLALREFGLYDESLRVCEDYDLWLDIAVKYLFYHIAEPLVIARVQPMNSTDSVSKEVWQQCYQKVKTRPRPRKGSV